MASNTFSIYIPSPLYEQVKELEKSKQLSVKEVCKQALQHAVSGNGGRPEPHGDLAAPEAARELADDASNIEYTLQYQANLTAAQAMMDNVRDQGGWTISLSKDNASEGFWLLFGYPRVLGED